MNKTLATLAVLAIVAAPRLLAHHSFAAEFDGSKPIRLTGALAKIEWTNPHSYFYIEACPCRRSGHLG